MILIDCTGIENKQQLHGLLAQKLAFPDYYGHNLDALFDCLMDIRQPTTIKLEGWSALGDWKQGFTDVFVDAALDDPHLDVIFA